MTGFVKKDVMEGSIGDLLRVKRQAAGEDFAAVEKATRVQAKYVQAIETNDFAHLPDSVYTKNFVRTLARHYGLDPEPLAREFAREMSAVGGREVSLDRPANFIDGRRLNVTPSLIKGGLVGLVFLAIIGYAAYSVYLILRPPQLVIEMPLDNQVFPTGDIVLAGRTEPEAELTINRETVLAEADGSFRDTLQLPPGVSILRVAAKKKHSKEREVFVQVVVESATSGSTVSATGTPKK